MADAASPEPAQPTRPTGALRRAAVGLLVAIIAAAIIYFATVLLLSAWARTLPERPDFTSNGVMWLITAIGVFDIFFVTAFLIIVFCIALPILFHRAAKASHHSLPLFAIIGVVIALEAIGIYFAFRGPPLILAIVGVPVLIGTTSALFIFGMGLNSRLAAAADA